jgi:hypothetical protein
VKLSFSAVVETQNNPIEITQSSIEDLVTKIIETVRQYTKSNNIGSADDGDVPDVDIMDLMERDFTQQKKRDDAMKTLIGKIQLNLLVTKAEASKLTRGRFMEQIVSSAWYVINPMTKKHCVADCLAVLQVYRSDMQLVSLWGYVKKTG